VRPLTVAAALAGALGLVAGCTSTSAETSAEDPPFHAADNPTVRPRGERVDPAGVLVLGDSLTNGAQLFGDLGDRLADAGFDDVTVVAQDARDTEWGIRQVRRRESVPPVVVVELGTNPGPETDGYQAAVTTMVDELRRRGAEEILWVTPVHARDDRYDDKVDILRATPGLEVLDWASAVHDDPRRLAADGLHPTEPGYGILAEFLTEAAVEAANH
jgi:lysophospholipase L1-like esterase